MTCLSILSDIATIATAAVTGGVAIFYFHVRSSKVTRLEDYLRGEKQSAKGGDQGQRSVMHLMANCGMSESDVLDAAFRSKHIKLPVAVDDEGFASKILLEYKTDNDSN